MSNPELELAFNFVENTGVNIFLTGRAGTGKTTFLHNLRINSNKRMVVVAPTGVAAINARGVTIHSFFQLPFGFYVPNSTRNDVGIHKFSKIKIKIIRSMELLVIDEISMVRADMLDAIDDVLRRFRDKGRPFGGVQLLMIGDLQQLSPVIRNEEWEVLKDHYDTPYFFDSIALKSSKYRNIELKHIYRQTDSHFIELLTKVRNGNLDNETLETLNKRCILGFSPDKKDGYITLTSHNNASKKINDKKLELLEEDEYRYSALIKGNFPESQYPMDAELVLKKGAQIMFTRNDSPERRYVNGTIGEIISISESEIKVELAESSEVIDVECTQWENIKYALDNETKEIKESVDGTFTQYPLKTAWAITIHKSQGLTFDKVVIDAANSFSHGQVYVALSRCRTIEGVVLSTPLRHDSIKKDSTVQYFSDEIEQHPPTGQQLLEDRQIYYQETLNELFGFDHLLINLRYIRRQLESNLINIYPKLVAKWNTHLELLTNDIENVSIKFRMQINKLMQNPNYENDTLLSERIIKGSIYFTEKCETIIFPLLSTLNIDIDNSEVSKIISGGMLRITESYKLKKATLDSCKDCFSVKKYLKAKYDTLATEEKVSSVKKSKSTPKEDKSVSYESDIEDVTNIKLFNALKKWRSKVAKDLDVALYMVAHQKVVITISATAPTTIKDLNRIKGVGKAFIDKYGEEVLTIVKKYSEEKDIFSE